MLGATPLPISDVDLVMFSDGESNLKRTEVFYVDEKAITMFPVNVKRLSRSKVNRFL